MAAPLTLGERHRGASARALAAISLHLCRHNDYSRPDARERELALWFGVFCVARPS